MSNLVYPALSGLDIKIKRAPVWSTEVLTAESGKEQRASWWSSPRYRFTLVYNFLRQDKNGDEFASIEGFFHRHRGQYESFLFTDPKDSSVTDHGFGAGDGTTVAFQLQRTASGLWTDALGTWPTYTTPRTNYAPALGNWGTTNATLTTGAAIATDGTLTACALTDMTTGGVQHFANSTTLLPAGTVHTFSVYAKAGTGSTLAMSNWGGLDTVFNLATGTITSMGTASSATITPMGNGWYRCTRTSIMGTNSNVYVSPASTNNYTGTGATIYLWGPQVETGTVATRYIPTTSTAVTVTPAYYPAGGDGFEPIYFLNGTPSIYRQDWQGNQLMYATARTNLCLYSQQFDNAAWSPQNGTITVNADIAPDGTATADKLTAASTGTNSPYILQGVTLPNPGTYTVSVWVKGYGGAIGKGCSPWIWEAGTGALVGGGNGLPSAWQTITGVWQRMTLLVQVATGGTFFLRVDFEFGASTAGDAIGLWGAQLELGSTATSYIGPTTTAAVTVTDYTLSSTGLVTFAVAPVNGAVLTWTGSYFYRVRFEQDELDFEREFSRVWNGKTVKLISTK